MNATALSEAIAAWAAGHPRIKRVWLADREEEVDVTVEPQPVADSEESAAEHRGMLAPGAASQQREGPPDLFRSVALLFLNAAGVDQ